MKKLFALVSAILVASFMAAPVFAGGTKMGKGSPAMMGLGNYAPEKLLGMNVNNMQGEHVGQIRDVNLDPDTGKINFVIVGSSLLGIGETKHAVLPDFLQIRDDRDVSTLTVSEDKLETAPNNTTGWTDEEFVSILKKHYGIATVTGGSMDESGRMMK